MEFFIFVFIALVVLLVAYQINKKSAIARREKAIYAYKFPLSIREKVKEKYPLLDDRQLYTVMQGLKEYFQLCNQAGRRMVSMPSQVVDVAWHEFILFTKQYESFCQLAFGRFLHHTPAEAMKSPTSAQAGIKTAWRIACFRQGIDPSSPHKLPLLFAIDTGIPKPLGSAGFSGN